MKERNDNTTTNASDLSEKSNESQQKPIYKVLGESGLVEDEDGNVYSATEIFPPKEPRKPIQFPKFQRNSFVSELDDKCNPAYWHYHYDPRYCGGLSVEEWMEKMAEKHRKMREQGIAEPELVGEKVHKQRGDCEYHLCEAARSHADLEQNEVVRLGLHPTFNSESYIRGLVFLGVRDIHGNVVISDLKYKFVGHFYCGLALAQDRHNKLFGFVDRHGKEVVPCTYRAADRFSEYMAGVQEANRLCGYVDTTGYLAIPCIWDNGWPFHEGVARVQKGKLIGMIDQSGKNIIPCIWKAMTDCFEGLIGVKNAEGKCGFINKSGEIVIPCQWRQVWSFKDGLAIVQDWNKRLGFIDKSGKVVIPCRWKKANHFEGSLAKVSDSKHFLFFKDKWVYIDRSGKVVVRER